MPTLQEMQAELDKLRAENQALQERRNGGTLSLKISDKGGLSVYGLGRFPVTLYKSQWLRLMEFIPQVSAFIKADTGKLQEKNAA